MQQHSGPQERILSLLEGYPSNFGGVEIAGSKLAHTEYIARMMHSRPGHWFLVGHRPNNGGARLGVDGSTARRQGYEMAEVNCNVYARVPHPSGLPIEALVTRRKPWNHHDKLPELTADRFGWSRGEMSDAMATARAWLFPIEGIAAA
jgi:hypothetical protein